MSSVLSPILHVASGAWTLGRIVDHRAEPCSKEDVEAVIAAVGERDALRAALEEACRCRGCGGSGIIDAVIPPHHWRCQDCWGTGRDYHGSEKARELLEAK